MRLNTAFVLSAKVGKMPSALLFGHSQTGGMGIDLANALKNAGYSVSRVVHNGAHDSQLVSFLSDLSDKQAASDKVFLYAGGNSDDPSVPDITALINYFGADRCTVILPPVNQGRDPAKIAAQRIKNDGNKAGLQAQDSTKNVRIYAIEADWDQFTANTDHVHLRAGSPASVALANQIVAEIDQPIDDGSLLTVILSLVAVGTAIYVWRR